MEYRKCCTDREEWVNRVDITDKKMLTGRNMGKYCPVNNQSNLRTNGTRRPISYGHIKRSQKSIPKTKLFHNMPFLK